MLLSDALLSGTTGKLAGRVTDIYAIEGGHNWPEIWTIPAIFAFVVFILFIIIYKNEKIEIEK